MATEKEIKEKFWKALKSDMTVMLGLAGRDDGRAQPMTAQLEEDGQGSIWFFSAKDVDLVQATGDGALARRAPCGANVCFRPIADISVASKHRE